MLLIATVDPQLHDGGFALSMAVLGVGMGLIVSQLGNVVQSSVDASGRGEAGGLQYTGQQLGSSLGVALIGAIVLAGLTNGFLQRIEADERISPTAAAQVTTAAGNGVDFVSAEQLHTAVADAGVDATSADAIVDDYESTQLKALKTGLLATGVLALISLMSTRYLPAKVAVGDADADGTGTAREQLVVEPNP